MIYRLTRLVFGLNQSPFILEGALQIHFESCIGMFRELLERVKGNMYVDDLVTREESTSEVCYLFQKGGFRLHK